MEINNDEMIEKMKYYHENRDRIEHQKRVDTYLLNQLEYGLILANETYPGKILKENGYEIFDLHQAQQDFRKVMRLDQIKEIAGIYFSYFIDENGKKQKKENIVSITKSNYYNAFYLPIWKNLAASERIKALEWMFETENESRKLDIKHIDYFLVQEELITENIKGLFDRTNNTLYIDLSDITEDEACCTLPMTLAHELMHAKQYNYAKHYDGKSKIDFYTLSQLDFAYPNNELLSWLEYGISDNISFALYRSKLSEKTAELKALKTLKKVLELNEKQFGKDKMNRKFYDEQKQIAFFDLPKLKKTSLFGKKRMLPTKGILSNEKIVLKGQSSILLKLWFLKSFYENKEYDLYEKKEENNKELKDLEIVYKKGNIDKNYYDDTHNKIEEKNEQIDNKTREIASKLTLIKNAFLSTLENGQLPGDFDKKEFDAFNLIDEPVKEYSLPKWLREDEDKFNKKIEEKTFE